MTSQRAKSSPSAHVNRRLQLRAAATVTFFLLTAAALVWLFYPALKRELTPASERYRHEGDQFLADGRLSEATLSYWQAVEANPDDAGALRSLAAAYQQQGRTRMAARYRGRLAEIEDAPGWEAGQENRPESLAGTLDLAWLVPAAEVAPTGGSVLEGRLVSAYEDGAVVALDAASGAEIWRVRLPSAATAPVSGDGELVWIGAQDGRIYALSLADGGAQWSFQTHGPVYAAPVADDIRVYCPSSDGTLYALEKQSGNPVWKFTTQGALHASPGVSAGVISIGSMDGKLYALEATSGAPVWQDGILTGGPVETQPLLYEGRVVFGSGDGRVYSLDPATGGQYWRVSTPDAVYARPMAVDGVVYVVSSGKTALALDFETGEKLWQTQLTSPARFTLAIAGDVIFITTDADPMLSLLDRSSGEILGQVDTGDWLAAGPILGDRMLYLLGKDGAVIAYRLGG